MIIMLSSDICRGIIRQQPPRLLAQLQHWSEHSAELVISAITYAELIAGVLLTEDQGRHMALVEEFRERLNDIVPWDRGAVDHYTAIQMNAMKAGHALNMNDAMVAAHALTLEAVLLTLNGKPFAGISGLETRQWES